MDEDVPRDYTLQWAALRRYTLFFYLVWIGGAILALVLSVHFRSLYNLLAILWLAGTFATGYPLGNFRCPRCGELFFKKPIGIGNYYNSFTRMCLHCGLPKWQVRG